MYLGFFAVAIFTSPVIISGIFYILLVCSRSKKSTSNKVHVALKFSDNEQINDEQFVENYNSNIPSINSKEMDEPTKIEVLGQESIELYRNLNLNESNTKNNVDKNNDERSSQSHQRIENSIATPTDLKTSIIKSDLEDVRIDRTETFDDSSIFENRLKTEQISDKNEAEKASAIRSLKTNFLLILMFSLSNLILFLPSKVWQTYFSLLETSIYKYLLPIFTTIANFGTIRSVGLQLWKILFKNKETMN